VATALDSTNAAASFGHRSRSWGGRSSAHAVQCAVRGRAQTSALPAAARQRSTSEPLIASHPSPTS